ERAAAQECREIRQADRVDHCGGRLGEQETATTARLLPVPDWQVVRYLLLALQPCDGIRLVADRIDQLEGARLLAREDASVRDAGKRSVVIGAALFHQALEPTIGVVYEGGQSGKSFRAGRLEPARRGLERGGFHFLHFDADRIEELREVRILHQ